MVIVFVVVVDVLVVAVIVLVVVVADVLVVVDPVSVVLVAVVLDAVLEVVVQSTLHMTGQCSLANTPWSATSAQSETRILDPQATASGTPRHEDGL